MGQEPAAPDVRRTDSPGSGARFILGFVIGLATTTVLAAVQSSFRGNEGLLVLGLALAAAGFLGGLLGGFTAYLGVWLGVATPVLVFALPFLLDGDCSASPFLIGCSRTIGLVIAGLALVVAPIPEGVGYILGRFVRWSLSEPEGDPR